MEDQEKAELGTHTFLTFCQQFGDDIYSQILLEELFKGLMYEEAVFVFGKPVEAGAQVSDSATERICDNIAVDGSVEPEPPFELAAPDLPDYP